jgi:hypothetical protein
MYSPPSPCSRVSGTTVNRHGLQLVFERPRHRTETLFWARTGAELGLVLTFFDDGGSNPLYVSGEPISWCNLRPNLPFLNGRPLSHVPRPVRSKLLADCTSGVASVEGRLWVIRFDPGARTST